ncbi:MAG: sensor histidine kinase KdpD [Rhizomicrobium sp.]|jgi:two-component system sensor histidine kinase KdpD
MAARIVEDRPSPEALLEQAKKEGRGKLKIFLGAAPGVGKTFEMLTQARQRRLEGVDVVIGVVETHGRIETDVLTKGFETIPKKRSLYKGHVVAEMDLDAVLQRRPKLVLVDELAHTNAAGSRHPKRYLDVAELLAAGIDVYTTINIQHIESLNDVVAQITRIHVRETIPDEVLDGADEIELVDTTSDDLLQRLREGKVYVKAQAERALRHFFSPGNLTALREIALRKAAQHVDRDMVDYMQAHAISGPWPAGEHILVCVTEHPSSAELVRRARRVADSLKTAWTALYIESPRHMSLSEVEKDRVADTMRLAQRLGAESVTLPGRDIAQSILEYARKNNVTQIVIGKSERSRWFEILHGSVARDLMRESGAISVTAVFAEGDAVAPKSVKTVPSVDARAWRHYGWSALAVAVTVGIAWVFNAAMAHALGSVGMLFLVPVLLSAVSFGLRPALFTAFVSVMAYNFFFLPPLYTFTIVDPNNWLSFAVLLLVAITAGNLAARVRVQADLAAARAAIAGELFRFTGKLAGIARLDDILWAAAFQIASMLKTNVVILLPDPATKRLEIRIGYPPEDELDAQDLAAAAWCWEKGKAAGRNAETLPGAKRLFLPMRTGGGLVGVIGLQRHDKALLTPEERRLLDALVDQTALATERAELVEKVDEAQVRAEADKLRVAMLTSLSHDLRTPLASILGAATTLIANRRLYDAGQTDEMLSTIREEAERLDRFVGNLLDMSRLEAGALGVKPEAIDVTETVDAASKRLARRLAGYRIERDFPADLPPAFADPLLLEQAVVNILDNAAKYAPAGSSIHIRGVVKEGKLALTIEDEGPGIPPEELPHIFDKFYRAKAADRRVAGTGLGLAVARGFVEAFGGTLEAANRTDRSGAVFSITVPMVPEGGTSHGR